MAQIFFSKIDFFLVELVSKRCYLNELVRNNHKIPDFRSLQSVRRREVPFTISAGLIQVFFPHAENCLALFVPFEDFGEYMTVYLSTRSSVLKEAVSTKN